MNETGVGTEKYGSKEKYGPDMDLMRYIEGLKAPRRLTGVSAWEGHIPFAFVLTAMLRPRMFVELGTHAGNSYCAFCQAIDELGLSTQAFAVDTWRGDEHSGFYDDSVYTELKAYHDPLYGSFSSLMRMTFDEARNSFAVGSIDLLHIDGLHTYEAVKHDFESWLPKMSRRGVVLFHDIGVRAGDFGVWRLWSELKDRYPAFHLEHSNGLGLVAVGEDIPDSIRPLTSDPVVAEKARRIFAFLGSLLSMQRPEMAPLSPEGSESERVAQVYYDRDGSDFSEEDSIKLDLNEDAGEVDWTVVCPISSRAVRVDLTNFPAVLVDVALDIIVNGEVIHLLTPKRADLIGIVVLQTGDWVVLGKDAQVRIGTLSLYNGALLRVRYKYRSAKAEELADAIREGLDRLSDYNSQLAGFSMLYDDAVRSAQKKDSEIASLSEELHTIKKDLQTAQAKWEQSCRLEDDLRRRVQDQQSDLDALERDLKRTSAALEETAARLKAVTQTRGWRALEFLRRLRSAVRHPVSTAKKVRRSLRETGIRATVQKIHRGLSSPTKSEDLPVDYDEWERKKESDFASREAQIQLEIRNWSSLPLVSIVMPAYNSEPMWLYDAVDSVIRQAYPNWELVISDDASPREDTRRALEEIADRDPRIKVLLNTENRGISGNSNTALSECQGELVTFLDHDDILSPRALYEIVREFLETPYDILYSDEDKLSEQGEFVDPFFKPDYSPDYLLSCNYVNHLLVYRRAILDQVGGFRPEYDGAQDFDLLLRAVERAGRVVHLPIVLYHWRKVPGSTAATFDAKSYAHEAGRKAVEAALKRRGEPGQVLDTGYSGHYRVKRVLQGQPLVSIIIPMRDKVEVLETCIESIRKSTYRNFEIIIVDNGSKEQKTLDYLRSLDDCTVLRYDIPFNYSRLNNMAAAEAKGDYLLFLNNDVEVITEDWLEEMLQHAMRPSVGVVGAKLLYPNDTIQHAGVVLGIGGIAGHSHKYFRADADGYFSSLFDIRNYSAVTGACMMVRKEVFEEVEGFNEKNLAVAFNDVDLCLKIGSQGLLCVFTPYAVLYHFESLTRGIEMNVTEIIYMYEAWGEQLENDPYYNPKLTRIKEDFSFSPDMDRPKLSHPFGISLEQFQRRLRQAGLQTPETEEALLRLWTVYCSRPDLIETFWSLGSDNLLKNLIEWGVSSGGVADSSKTALEPYHLQYKRIHSNLNRQSSESARA